jgi:hypothetical protein
VSKALKLMALLVCVLFGVATAAGQNLPQLNMGYSGAGIGSDLLKIIDRAGLWRKQGVDVRTFRAAR